MLWRAPGALHVCQAFPTLGSVPVGFGAVLCFFLAAPLCPLLFLGDNTGIAGKVVCEELAGLPGCVQARKGLRT